MQGISSWQCGADRTDGTPRRSVRLANKTRSLRFGHAKTGAHRLHSVFSRQTAPRAHRSVRYPGPRNTGGAAAVRNSHGNGGDLRPTCHAVAARGPATVPFFQSASLSRPAGRRPPPRRARPRARAGACTLPRAPCAQRRRGRLLMVGPMREAGPRPRGLRRLRSGSGDPDHAVRDDAGPGSRARPGGVRLHIRTAGRGGALPMPAAVPPAAVAAPARQPAHVPAQDQPPAGAQLLRARRPMAAARGRPYREDHGKERR